MVRRWIIGTSVALLAASLIGCSKPKPKYEGLSQVATGIYSYAMQRIAIEDDVAVVVHPFYLQSESVSNYLYNLDRFIPSFKGTMIVIESYESMKTTSRRIMSLGRTNETFFVPSKLYSPFPEEITWDGLAAFLKNEGISNVRLVGGYYRGTNEGCLGVTEYELGSRGISGQVMEGLVFCY